ncbi:MAG TPA: hypothetical protein VGP92_13910 [Acidimicrobiia bacterium]|nr:hypothetical protein [Acidimicrobiia bacterium]
MKVLPRAEKRAIMKSVRRGKRVDDPERARMAVEYAVNWARWCRWMAGLYSLLAVGNVVLAVVEPSWYRFVLAALWVIIAPAHFYNGFRAKRSIPLNQAIIGVG